jgi:hypothetical protein
MSRKPTARQIVEFWSEIWLFPSRLTQRRIPTKSEARTVLPSANHANCRLFARAVYARVAAPIDIRKRVPPIPPHRAEISEVKPTLHCPKGRAWRCLVRPEQLETASDRRTHVWPNYLELGGPVGKSSQTPSLFPNSFVSLDALYCLALSGQSI